MLFSKFPKHANSGIKNLLACFFPYSWNLLFCVVSDEQDTTESLTKQLILFNDLVSFKIQIHTNKSAYNRQMRQKKIQELVEVFTSFFLIQKATYQSNE